MAESWGVPVEVRLQEEGLTYPLRSWPREAALCKYQLGGTASCPECMAAAYPRVGRTAAVSEARCRHTDRGTLLVGRLCEVPAAETGPLLHSPCVGPLRAESLLK